MKAGNCCVLIHNVMFYIVLIHRTTVLDTYCLQGLAGHGGCWVKQLLTFTSLIGESLLIIYPNHCFSVLSLQKKGMGVSRELTLLPCLFIDFLCEQLISGGRLAACHSEGIDPPCPHPDSPLPLLIQTLSLQLEISVLHLIYFLSYHSSQECLGLCLQTFCLSKCT